MREWRNARGISLPTLARKLNETWPGLNIRWQSLQRYETGERQLPVQLIPKIAVILEIDAGDLIETDAGQRVPGERVIVEIYRRLAGEDRDRLIRMANALAEPTTPYDPGPPKSGR